MFSFEALKHRRILSLAASATLLIAICAAIGKNGLLTALDILTAGKLTGHLWSVAELDADGRLISLGASPFLIFAVLGLLSFSCAWTGAAAARLLLPAGTLREPAGGQDRLEAAKRLLDAELSTVLGLLQSRLSSSERYARLLNEAGGKLKEAPASERLQRIADLLIAENTREKVEIESLRQGLSASQDQIRRLQDNLNEAEKLVMIDPLTALKNRRWLQQNLSRLLLEAKGSGSTLSIAMADIDHFKRLNDQFGHQIGDEILVKFGALLSAHAKEHDVAVRYGGEEFTIVMPGRTRSQAWLIAERIRCDLEAKQWINDLTGQSLGKITASFGVAEAGPVEQVDELIRRADGQMYDAKKGGRNRVAAGTGPD